MTGCAYRAPLLLERRHPLTFTGHPTPEIDAWERQQARFDEMVAAMDGALDPFEPGMFVQHIREAIDRCRAAYAAGRMDL